MGKKKKGRTSSKAEKKRRRNPNALWVRKVKDLLAKKGMTRKTLAAKVHYKYGTINNILWNGWPPKEKVEWARALGVLAEYLFNDKVPLGLEHMVTSQALKKHRDALLAAADSLSDEVERLNGSKPPVDQTGKKSPRP